MSWFNTLTSSIFSNSQEQVLPIPPSAIAAGAPWYGELSPAREEIIRRIHKDILQSNPELKSLNLQKLIEETMEEISIGSYRDYYSNRHRILVNEIREDAIELHKKRHVRNMQLFYFIATTKMRIRALIKEFRMQRLARTQRHRPRAVGVHDEAAVHVDTEQ